MRTREDASTDSIVTDPPYELGFMGKRWDASGIAYNVDMWRECLRVLKPGGHLLAFGGTRTYHRMACAIEDAGFEIRDCIAWIYGAGFPKSLDISKAIDKEAGADAAIQWQGWGTGLKPAMEPVVVARKPISEPTVAQNVLKWGTGGMNIDACRVRGDMASAHYGGRQLVDSKIFRRLGGNGYQTQPHSGGRFPANLVLDEEAAAMLDEMSGGGRLAFRGVERTAHENISGTGAPAIGSIGTPITVPIERDSERPSRFFYVAKAPSSERWFYCRDCQNAYSRKEREAHWHGHVNAKGEKTWEHLIEHPTVKPVSLMRWLCRLVTPPSGLILDPFAGSGSTLVAAQEEGFSAIGIEREHEYVEIARKRIGNAQLSLAV